MKKWFLLHESPVKKLDEIIKVLLINRGIKTKKEIKDFFDPPSPYTLTAVDLGINRHEFTKAVKRIKQAIKSGEKIMIYGDYDTDGVCATAIIWEILHKLGAQVMPFIPTREEGYGLKTERIDQFKNEGISLIITVDHGIVAYPQAEHAKKIGIDLVVTDHHLPGEKKLQSWALVHTTKLSGAGVSWFLSSQLGRPTLDLATLGTVSDMMPLQEANRAMVKYGLKHLRETKRPGLLSLYQAAGLAKENIGTYEVSFVIGPRLNAAGRMEDPMEALRLLCTQDDQRAKILAEKIDQQNRARQLLTEQTTIHARDLWKAEGGKTKLIFVSHESYEEGIVGLVAGKLVEEFYRPTIVVAKGEQYSRASGRSINGFNIVEALRACADILGPHGGHPLAAGFTVETTKLEELKNRLTQLAEEQIDDEKLTPVLKIDLEVVPEDLSFSLWEQLARFGPFGTGNPEPVFLSHNLVIVDAKTVGNGNQHLALTVQSAVSDLKLRAIAFGMGVMLSQLSPGRKVDLVYNLISDQWNGQKKLQLKIKDLNWYN